MSVAGSALRLPGLPNLATVPAAVLDHVPQLRRELERRLGPEGADLLVSALNATTAALTVAPTTAAAEAALRTMLAVEAWNGRTAWSRHEPALSRGCPSEDADDIVAAEKPLPPEGSGERYAKRAVTTGLGAAAVMGALSHGLRSAATAMLVTVPKPMRASREAFGCALSRGLTTSHDALVIRPRALRTFDRVDVVVIDPRLLYTDGLIVSRVRDVPDPQRANAWACARAALDAGDLSPGWHRLATIAGAGQVGEVLVSPLRDPLATALVAEARRTKRRVVSLDDDGLRSLAKGFDDLRVVDGSVDHALASVVADLQGEGATVALLTTTSWRAARTADVTIGLARPDRPPPWGADVIITDLAAAWRVLHALPAARTATKRGIQVSVSSSVIGALMMIPGVAGNGTASVDSGRRRDSVVGIPGRVGGISWRPATAGTGPGLARPHRHGGAAAAAPTAGRRHRRSVRFQRESAG